MADDTQVVHKNDQAATTDQIKDEDYLAAIKAKDDELVKVTEERNNYRQGLLKHKGKLPQDADTDQIEIMRQVAREEFLKTREGQLNAEKDALFAKALKENSELKLALKNKAQPSNTGHGASSESVEVRDNFLSENQEKSLKAQGWDDKKIERFKENLRKNKR